MDLLKLSSHVNECKPLPLLGGSGLAGFGDGRGSAVRFNNPMNIAADRQGNVFVADLLNHRIRRISPQGEVTTLAGSGAASFADAPSGSGTSAGFNRPSGIAVGASDETPHRYFPHFRCASSKFPL
jgi:hypothetical protein